MGFLNIPTDDDLLKQLKEGNSPFRYIPDDIGEIVYCNSTNPKGAPDSKKSNVIKAILSVVIPLALVLICWLLMEWDGTSKFLVTVLLACVSYGMVYDSIHFKGKDFFVGTEGAAIVSFEKTRDNYTLNTIIRFDEVDDVLSGEQQKYRRGRYEQTDYHFTFYSKEKDNQREVIAHVADHYEQRNPNGNYSDVKMKSWKKIEEQWTKYKVAQVSEAFKSGQGVSFNYYDRDGYTNDYIIIREGELVLSGNVFNVDNTGTARITKKMFVVELEGYKTYLFGTIEKNSRITIPLHAIANRIIFYQYIREFTDYVTYKLSIPEYCEFDTVWNKPIALRNTGAGKDHT